MKMTKAVQIHMYDAVEDYFSVAPWAPVIVKIWVKNPNAHRLYINKGKYESVYIDYNTGEVVGTGALADSAKFVMDALFSEYGETETSTEKAKRSFTRLGLYGIATPASKSDKSTIFKAAWKLARANASGTLNSAKACFGRALKTIYACLKEAYA